MMKDKSLLKDFELVKELDDKAAQLVSGGTEWLCMWPEDWTGAYYPPAIGSGSLVSDGTWHYFDYTLSTWMNTWYSCYPVGYMTFT